MLQRSLFARTLSLVLCISLFGAVNAAEQTTKPAPTKTIELKLDAKGNVVGQLVNAQGKPVAGADVTVSTRQGKLGSVKTDKRGVFAVAGLKPGAIALSAGNRTQAVRIWDGKTAPPNAVSYAMLVSGDAVRAQCGSDCGGCNSCSPAPSCGPACGGCNACGGHGGGGFFGHGAGRGLLSRPWLLGAGVAAAIAIPIALDDDDAS